MPPRDVNLKLAASGVPIAANGNGTAVNTEGGFFADVVVEIPTLQVDSDETDAIIVQASIDGGSNYFNIGVLPTITAAAVLADITTNKRLTFKVSRPVYVPRPNSSNTVTKVRLNHTVAGTTPSFAIDSWLEPRISLAVQAVDEAAAIGLARLY